MLKQWKERLRLLSIMDGLVPRRLWLGGALLACLTVLMGMALLGLSGWFITATALAGLLPAVAQMFDVFMPSAGIRLLAVGRTGARYAERLVTHDATLAALDCFAGRRIALLVGGHDRGVDWSDFAAHMRHDAPATLITMGANGPRIHALLAPVAQEAGFTLIGVETLPEAMTAARGALGGEGVVLLSPGAPSFGQYKDYVARGRHFAELAGFDPDAITAIPGLGLA